MATDGVVTDGPYPEAIGGYTLIDVPSREGGAAVGGQDRRRLPLREEVREIGADPELDAMLRQAGSRR